MKFNKVPNGKLLSHIYLEINLMMLFFLEVLFLRHSTDSQICEKQEFLDFASFWEAGKKHQGLLLVPGGECESFLLGFLFVDNVAWVGGSVCCTVFKTLPCPILDQINITFPLRQTFSKPKARCDCFNYDSLISDVKMLLLTGNIILESIKSW